MSTVLTSARRNGNGTRIGVPSPAKPVRVGIYTRQSVSENGADSASLKVQRESAEAYVLSQRAENWIALPDRYDDAGFSGGTTERPALRRLIADVESGRVDVVLTYKVDRLSRSLLDFVKMVDLFDRHEVRFVSVTQAFDSRSSLGRLSLGIMATFSEYERQLIRERTRDAVAARKRAGQWCGGIAPLGYRIEGKKLIVDPAEAFEVQEMFRLYEEQRSLIDVAATLNSLGRRTKATAKKDGTPRGAVEWSKSSVHRTLTSPVYIARIVSRGEIHVAAHEAIVPLDQWERVQAKLQSNGGPHTRCERHPSNSVLGGLLRCPLCSSSMTATFARKGARRYEYLACSRRQKGGKTACPQPYVSAAKAEARFVAEIARHATDPKLVEAVVEAAKSQLADRKRALSDEARSVRRAIKDCEREIERGTVDGGSAGCIDGRIGELRQRASALEREREALDATRIETEEVAGMLAGSFDQVWGAMTTRERRRVVNVMVVNRHSRHREQPSSCSIT